LEHLAASDKKYTTTLATNKQGNDVNDCEFVALLALVGATFFLRPVSNFASVTSALEVKYAMQYMYNKRTPKKPITPNTMESIPNVTHALRVIVCVSLKNASPSSFFFSREPVLSSREVFWYLPCISSSRVNADVSKRFTR
jgi:hypothetical protein